MEVVLSVLIGGLFATALYTMLRRSIVRLAIGLTLLAHAANLLIFTVNGVTRAGPPLVPEGEEAPLGGFADPLPQALILTAIVIGFGVLAFLLVLVKRAYQTVGSDDIDEMTSTER
jgi:multicomponent Na+:H+ antiporter subunit C